MYEVKTYTRQFDPGFGFAPRPREIVRVDQDADVREYDALARALALEGLRLEYLDVDGDSTIVYTITESD
jgi:hypothetical protein